MLLPTLARISHLQLFLSLSLSLSLCLFFRARVITWTPAYFNFMSNLRLRSTRTGFREAHAKPRHVLFPDSGVYSPPLPHPPVAAGRFQFSFIGEHMRFFSSWSIKNRWDRCANYVSRMRTYKISFLRVVPRGCYFEAEFWLGTRLPGYLMAKLQSLLKRMIKLNFKVEPFEFSTRDAAVFTKLPSIPYAWEATKKMRFYLWMPSWSGWRITD